MVPKYREFRYGRLDTLNIKIRPLIEENKCNNSGTEERNGTEEYSWYYECFDYWIQTVT